MISKNKSNSSRNRLKLIVKKIYSEEIFNHNFLAKRTLTFTSAKYSKCYHWVPDIKINFKRIFLLSFLLKFVYYFQFECTSFLIIGKSHNFHYFEVNERLIDINSSRLELWNLLVLNLVHICQWKFINVAQIYLIYQIMAKFSFLSRHY
jgi:hypothetical protein